MKKRSLGDTGLEVSVLALGGNVFGWTVDEPTAFAILNAYTEAGGNFIDTADSYSRWAPGNKGGESETIIGQWLVRTGKRNAVIIATKVGSDMGQDRKGLSRSYILRAVEDSLKRLRTDRIDLYQSHFDDPAVPLEETLEAYSRLIREGKVRALGASNYSRDRLLQALRTSRKEGFPAYQSLQPLYNLYDRSEYEQTLEPLCRDERLSVISYSSLASGFLTGKYRAEGDLAKSVRGHGIRKYLTARGLRILSALDRVASDYHTSPASVALAWLMARPGMTAPIASATSLEQLRSLIDATDLELVPPVIEVLNQESS